MKNAGKTALILTLSLGLQAFSFSQEKITLTLEECIRLALLQNPFFEAEKAKEEQASYYVREAISKFLPSLNAQGMDVLDKKAFSLDVPSLLPGLSPQRIKLDLTRTYHLSLSLSVPLYTGGRLTSGYKQANYGLLSAQEAIRQARQETVFKVKKAFYGILLARKIADAAEEAVSLAEKHLKNVESLYGVEMASKFELLRAEVQLANLKPQLIRAANGLKTAELGLKVILGLDLRQPVEVKGELSYQAFEADLDDHVARALANRPEILQLRYQKLMAAEMIKTARAAYLPVVAVGGVFHYGSDRFNLRKDSWESYYSVNLLLNIPIFNGLAEAAKVGQSKAVLKQIQYSQKGLLEMVKLEVHESILSLQQARESILSQEKNVEQAREAVKIAELSFTEGLATDLDVSSLHVALSQARTNHSQALYEYVMALALLEKAIGAGPDIPRDVANDRDGENR
jgi:outer membrane protein